jgi:hypothetical protein
MATRKSSPTVQGAYVKGSEPHRPGQPAETIKQPIPKRPTQRQPSRQRTGHADAPVGGWDWPDPKSTKWRGT